MSTTYNRDKTNSLFLTLLESDTLMCQSHLVWETCEYYVTIQPRMGLGTITWSVDQGFQKYSDWSNDIEEDDVEMTGEGSGEESLVWMRIPFEKQISLTNKTSVNNSETQQHQDMSNHILSINWRSGSKKTLICE
jgi:hypothetical protein